MQKTISQFQPQLTQERQPGNRYRQSSGKLLHPLCPCLAKRNLINGLKKQEKFYRTKAHNQIHNKSILELLSEKKLLDTATLTGQNDKL